MFIYEVKLTPRHPLFLNCSLQRFFSVFPSKDKVVEAIDTERKKVSIAYDSLYTMYLLGANQFNWSAAEQDFSRGARFRTYLSEGESEAASSVSPTKIEIQKHILM